MLWLLAIDGIRLRKRRCGEGGPKIRARRSQAGSCSIGILGCPFSGSALIADVGDRGCSQDNDMDGQVEWGNSEGLWSHIVQASSYIP